MTPKTNPHPEQQHPHMRRAPRAAHPTAGAGSRPASRTGGVRRGTAPHRAPGRRPQAPAGRGARAASPRPRARSGAAPRRRGWPLALGGAAVAVIAILAIWGLASAIGGALSGGGAPEGGDGSRGGQATVLDSAASDPGDIVIGVNGDEDTMVLAGEDYLEAGAHAASPSKGILTPDIETSGEVDSSKAGDYTVTYTVSDGAGHTASAKRTVHVVDEMDTMQGSVPVLMYHYVYSADNPPESVDGNYMLDTNLEAQLAYLSDNDFYFPSFPEIQAFVKGEHSLPARSVALTFDDGEDGFLKVGGPLLEKYRVPATSFVITSDAGAAERIAASANPYISFESHSDNMHRAGGTVGHGGIISAMTGDEIVEDIETSQQVVGSGQAFAYPFGDVTDDAEAAVEETGVLCAFTTENRRAAVGDDVYALPRVRISGDYTLDGYKSLVG